MSTMGAKFPFYARFLAVTSIFLQGRFGVLRPAITAVTYKATIIRGLMLLRMYILSKIRTTRMNVEPYVVIIGFGHRIICLSLPNDT
jgi:hypothetical protein